jgi:hypothetical protein
VDRNKLLEISDFNASNPQEQYTKLCKANELLLAAGLQTNQGFCNLLALLMCQQYQDVDDIDFGFDLKPAPFPVHSALPSRPASTLPPSITVVALLLAVSLTTSTLSLQVVRPASGAWPKSSSRGVLTLPMRAQHDLFAVVHSRSSRAVPVLKSRSRNNICSLSPQTTTVRARRESYSSTGHLQKLKLARSLCKHTQDQSQARCPRTLTMSSSRRSMISSTPLQPDTEEYVPYLAAAYIFVYEY